MSDKPERIWAKPSREHGWLFADASNVYSDDEGAEYVRADVALAMVAAALEESAEKLRAARRTGAASTDYYGGVSDACNMLPMMRPDALAALEAVKEEAMKEGMRLATSVPIEELPAAFAAAIRSQEGEG